VRWGGWGRWGRARWAGRGHHALVLVTVGFWWQLVLVTVGVGGCCFSEYFLCVRRCLFIGFAVGDLYRKIVACTRDRLRQKNT